MTTTDSSKTGSDPRPKISRIVGDAPTEPPGRGSEEPQRPPDPQTPPKVSMSPVQRPIETQSSQPTRTVYGAAPERDRY